MFLAVQLTIAKCWKQPECPSVNEWIKILWYIYTMKYYYAAERKKELLPFVTAWMELESIMLSEISQVAKDKYHYDLTYKWNLVNKTNEQNRTRDVEIKNIVTATRRVGMRDNGERGGKGLVKDLV